MSISRRGLLAGIAWTIPLSAGCTASSDDVPSYSGPVREPETATVRNTDGETILASETQSSETNRFVADADWIDQVTFATGVSDADVAEAEQFVESTDFESQSLYVVSTQYQSCDRWHILSVKWADSRVELETCLSDRSANEYCRANAFEPRMKLVRIPDRVEAGEVTSSSVSQRGCPGREPDDQTIDTGSKGE